jgi:hypothetical protein
VLDEFDGRFDAIPGIAGAAADPEWAGRHRGKTPKRIAAAVITSVAAKSHGPVKR